MSPSLLFPIFVFLCLFENTWSQNECQATGNICDQNCNIAFCTGAGATPVTLQECFKNTGKYCTLVDGYPKCAASACGGSNGTESVICTAAGVVPSPIQCSRAYICEKKNSFPSKQCTCPDGQYYDSRLLTCMVGQCPREIPSVYCNSTGEDLTIDNDYCLGCDDNLNGFIYYCNTMKMTIQTPRLIKPKAWTCVDYNATNSTNPETPTPPPTTPPINATCTVSGQRFPNPQNCRTFYLCDSSLKLVLKECPTDFYYNQTRLGCVRGNCNNNIPSNTTCSTPGQRFPNPLDCRTFYFCNNTGSMVLIDCPLQFYYDAQRLGCVRGTCTNNISTYNTCTAPGKRLPNPHNCSGFYLCDNTRTLIPKQCPPKFYFDQVRSQCVRGKCPNFF